MSGKQLFLTLFLMIIVGTSCAPGDAVLVLEPPTSVAVATPTLAGAPQANQRPAYPSNENPGTIVPPEETFPSAKEYSAQSYPAPADTLLPINPYPAPINPTQTATPTVLVEISPPKRRPFPISPTPFPEQAAVVDAARGVLAEHLGLPVEQIFLLYLEPAEWRDTSLGCPQEGKSYAQAIVPGYRIFLRAEDSQYELHTDNRGGRVLLCTGPAAGERFPLGRQQSEEEMVEQARQNLAELLDVPMESVELVSVEEAAWEDDSLGCRRPPGKYPDRAYARPIFGYRIVLSVEGVHYEYHTSGFWMVFCSP